MTKRVIITGASGFIGRHCIPELLSLGFEVHAVARSAGQNQDGVFWHSIDILKHGTVEKLIQKVSPSHLLHLAWNAKPGIFWTSPDNLEWVRASIDLLKSFAECGGKRIVMAGSCAEYDWSYGWCSEYTTPLKPHTLYGASKNALQSLLFSYSLQLKLSATWGRVFFLFGEQEHCSRLVPDITLSLLDNQTAACSLGCQVRDYLYVKDAARGFAKLLASEVTGPVNIASGTGISVRELVTMVGKQLDKLHLIKFGTLTPKPTDPPFLVADNRRLITEVGWKPSVDRETAIRNTVEWWKKSRM